MSHVSQTRHCTGAVRQATCADDSTGKPVTMPELLPETHSKFKLGMRHGMLALSEAVVKDAAELEKIFEQPVVASQRPQRAQPGPSSKPSVVPSSKPTTSAKGKEPEQPRQVSARSESRTDTRPANSTAAPAKPAFTPFVPTRPRVSVPNFRAPIVPSYRKADLKPFPDSKLIHAPAHKRRRESGDQPGEEKRIRLQGGEVE